MTHERWPTPKLTEDVERRMVERELQLIERDLKEAEHNVELWGGSWQAVLEDLAEVEKDEGPLDPEDPRLTAAKICAMRLDEAKRMVRDLKEERAEAVNRAGSN